MASLARQRRMLIAVFLVVGYLTLMHFSPLVDRLLLHPSVDPIPAFGARAELVEVGDERIEFYVARSAACVGECKAYVLHFTGNAGRAESTATAVAQLWSEQAVEVWAVNYPGFGGSSGPPSLNRLPKLGLAAYDELARRANGRPIYLHSISMGCTVSLYVAGEREVAGLILQNPPPLKPLIIEQFGWWNAWLIAGPLATAVPVELDAIPQAQLCRQRAIFITSERDALVPPRFQKRIVEAYAGETRRIIMRNVGHNEFATKGSYDALRRHLPWLMQASE